MSTALQPVPATGLSVPGLPSVPWRDPHTVSPEALAQTIRSLQSQCLANPQSADLHTCLGMAYAMNFEAYKSMDALEKAVIAEPRHFWAQMKLAELQYRLRCLDRAEEETSRALDLAGSPWETALVLFLVVISMTQVWR
ncbi:MAG: hypothetical protein NTW28_18660 [Candidatus Solibacter sp.]|nr:hypothetical protein [Candidatus Solibacter sp.]